MPTDILKRPIDHCILMDFLSKISSLHKNEYFITYDSFKRAKYNNNELIHVFFNQIRPHYYISKRAYLDETIITYRRFLTILRQICNYNNIPYRSRLKYEHSKQKVEYFIYNTTLDDDISNDHCEKETCGSSDLDEDA